MTSTSWQYSRRSRASKAIDKARAILAALEPFTRGFRNPTDNQTTPKRRSHSNFIASELNGNFPCQKTAPMASQAWTELIESLLHFPPGRESSVAENPALLVVVLLDRRHDG